MLSGVINRMKARSNTKYFLNIILRLLLLTMLIFISPRQLERDAQVRASPQANDTNCRIAITVPYGIDGYDIASLGINSLLDWEVDPPATLPPNIEHIKVLRVRSDIYNYYVNTLPAWLSIYPGSTWVIGNEPDTWHSQQDNNTPEVYAQRFFQLASILRSDPNAKIGFAPIVQPTPIRLRYLDRVMARLDDPDLAGSLEAAKGLIDIYVPHAFILNEQPGYEWGAGIPPGFENDYADAMVITDPEETHNIEIFKTLVRNFRQWLKNNGEQNKPVWITEYGSLMPPLDPPSGIDFYNVSDEVTRDFMLASYEFLLGAEGIDLDLGYPADDHRLVQRAYWYSLNEYRWRFGGALFDPIDKSRTIVGNGFVTYNPDDLVGVPDPDIFPISAEVIPLRYTPGSGKMRVDYLLFVRVGNHVPGNLLTNINVELFEQAVLADMQPGQLPRCGGEGIIALYWSNVGPNIAHHLEITAHVDPASGTDIDLSNNTLFLSITPISTPLENFLPLLSR